MAGNPSLKKRQRELQRKEQRAEKSAKRAERKAVRDQKDPGAPGEEDPDLAGIVPGPQPLPDEQA